MAGALIQMLDAPGVLFKDNSRRDVPNNVGDKCAIDIYVTVFGSR